MIPYFEQPALSLGPITIHLFGLLVALAHMGRRTFEFTADNPGDWLFHCHNLYHLEAGMARVFRYV